MEFRISPAYSRDSRQRARAHRSAHRIADVRANVAARSAHRWRDVLLIHGDIHLFDVEIKSLQSVEQQPSRVPGKEFWTVTVPPRGGGASR